MNSFVYNIPVKVYFGENQLQHLSEELAKAEEDASNAFKGETGPVDEYPWRNNALAKCSLWSYQINRDIL